MTPKDQTPELPEGLVLLERAEEVLPGWTVRPWTVDQLLRLSPHLEALAKELEARGVAWEQLEAALEQPPALSQVFGGLGVFLPLLAPVAAISCGKAAEEFGALELGDAWRVLLRIAAVNVHHLSAFFGQAVLEAAALLAAARTR